MGVLKTHSPYRRIPAKVVYLLRDGRDTMLSLYTYSRRSEGVAPPEEIGNDVGEFFLRTHAFGTWHDHLLGWIEGLRTWPRDRSMLLRYEDLRADPERRLSMLLAFTGIEVDPKRVTRAVERTTKDRLAAIDTRAGAGALEFPALTRHTWQDVLSDEEIRRYEAVAGRALLRGGYPLATRQPTLRVSESARR
jgi:hypothetical protein